MTEGEGVRKSPNLCDVINGRSPLIKEGHSIRFQSQMLIEFQIKSREETFESIW